MSNGNADHLYRAYARLKALRESLPNHADLEARLVIEFHQALDHLQEAGMDVEEFRVPADALYPFVRGGSLMMVSAPLFRAKLDGVLTYFEIATSNPTPQIGFRKA